MKGKTVRTDLRHNAPLTPWRIVGALIRGMVQVVAVAADRSETVLEPCLTKSSGEEFAASYNATCRTGKKAVIRDIALPCLARNSAR
jgi:hypothetical protein